MSLAARRYKTTQAKRRRARRRAAREAEPKTPIATHRYDLVMPLEVRESFREQAREAFLLSMQRLSASRLDWTISASVTNKGITVTLKNVEAHSEQHARERAVYWCRRAVSSRKGLTWTGLPINDIEVKPHGNA